MSTTVTASEARRSLFPLIGAVNNDAEPVLITSKAGNAILISESEYTSLEETAHLLRSPTNARRLLESLADVDQRSQRELAD